MGKHRQTVGKCVHKTWGEKEEILFYVPEGQEDE